MSIPRHLLLFYPEQKWTPGIAMSPSAYNNRVNNFKKIRKHFPCKPKKINLCQFQGCDVGWNEAEVQVSCSYYIANIEATHKFRWSKLASLLFFGGLGLSARLKISPLPSSVHATQIVQYVCKCLHFFNNLVYILSRLLPKSTYLAERHIQTTLEANSATG